MKRIALFGSTGSIGTQTADIVAKYPDRFVLTSCFANKNIALLKEQAESFNVKYIGLYDHDFHTQLKADYHGKAELVDPNEDIKHVLDEADTIVVAISGFSAIGVTLKALELGKTVAIATKEVLVSAGHIVNEYISEYHGKIVPIDSEHSAIWQCLQGINVGGDYRDHVERLILTASGGPFRGWSRSQMENVTVEQALKHPNWSMGAKITIDSATMMNKGLEVIEAQRLYNVLPSKIDILVHPQSIVHSMVECIDGNVIAQLGNANMRHPILYALTYPERVETRFGRLDFTQISVLTFEKPDMENFPCIQLAYEVLEKGGIAPAVLNGANEKAVELFLKRELKFMEISQFVQSKINLLCDNSNTKVGLSEIVEADRLSREY